MCTIMTLDRDKFETHHAAIIKQITLDFAMNPHGSALLLDTGVFIQCPKIETILTLLNNDKTWNRFWLHQRFSSTSAEGLSGVHGFWDKSRTYLTFHNGVINQDKASEYPVDSMIIPELIDVLGINDAALYIATNYAYANVFIVDPANNKYYVIRGTMGGLYCDGTGNYSTSMVADINIKVEDKTAIVYSATKTSLYKVAFSFSSTDRINWGDEWTKDTKTTKGTKTNWASSTDSEDEIYFKSLLAELPKMSNSDLIDTYYSEYWDLDGLPDEVYCLLSESQLDVILKEMDKPYNQKQANQYY